MQSGALLNRALFPTPSGSRRRRLASACGHALPSVCLGVESKHRNRVCPLNRTPHPVQMYSPSGVAHHRTAESKERPSAAAVAPLGNGAASRGPTLDDKLGSERHDRSQPGGRLALGDFACVTTQAKRGSDAGGKVSNGAAIEPIRRMTAGLRVPVARASSGFVRSLSDPD